MANSTLTHLRRFAAGALAFGMVLAVVLILIAYPVIFRGALFGVAIYMIGFAVEMAVTSWLAQRKSRREHPEAWSDKA